MRGLLWLLVLFAVAVGLAMTAQFNDAYLLMVIPPWRIEVSLNLALTVLVGGFFLLYMSLRGVALTFSLPGKVKEFRERRRRKKAAAIFQDAVRLLFEGRFGHALKKAAEAHAAGEAPGLAALIAARAAQRLREPGKQEAWLDRATLDDARTEAARLMLEAEMYLDARRFEEAVAVLARLQQLSGRHIAALRLELRAQQGCGNWEEVLRIARLLEKRDALTREVAYEIKVKAHRHNVEARRTDAAGLRSYLARVPSEETSPKLTGDVVLALTALGDLTEARKVLEKQLDREWDSSLILRYADAGDDATARIARAEAWLKLHPQDAGLLLVLGRLCAKQQLWGKAQSYLEASLSLESSRDTLLELAQLADQLGRTDEANRHYRAAVRIASNSQ
ncbi:MAG: heme biosynthesis protein HemY [Zoogloeaceae bacterium]|nr:heme biosynthesis protein HemY [Zoogloeaceae bacterium]